MMRTDVLHLARALRRSRASAITVVVTLSLTLGAGVSIFSIVDAVLLTPLPFDDPAALVAIGERPVDDPAATPRAVPYATFQEWRGRAASLATLEAYDGTNLTLTGLGAAERINAIDATPGLFAMLGVTPAQGRRFAQDDVGAPVVIVSDTFWRTHLGRDASALGRTLTLGSRPHTIVGVLAPMVDFRFGTAQIWRPLPLSAAEAIRTGYRVQVLARLADGVTGDTMASVLDDVSVMSRPPARAAVQPLADVALAGSPLTLSLLAGGALVAVVIAFANLATLLIVRSIDRRRELAVRNALGAPAGEVARQLLFESAALAAVGVVGGVAAGVWLTPAVGRVVLEFSGLPERTVTASLASVSAVGALALVCAALCTVPPALKAATWKVGDVLRRGVTASRSELAVRRAFVAAEVALAFVLLVSMTLLGRTLLDVLRTNPGFEPRGVLALAVSLPRAAYPSRERAIAFYTSLQSALRSRLGDTAVAVIDELPLTHDRGRSIVGLSRSASGPEAVVRAISPSYFDVMRIPVIAGRDFSEQGRGGPPDVIVSQALAARLFPAGDAVGRQLWVAALEGFGQIVGVVGDVKLRALDDPVVPTIYLAASRAPSPSSLIVVRSPRTHTDVTTIVREEVARLDPNLPVYGVRSMEEIADASPGVRTRRLLTTVFAGFAIVALVLSTIGLFGLAAHDVACRRAELAIRLALGATQGQVLRATTGRGLLMIGVGLAAGGALSLLAGQSFAGAVFIRQTWDVPSVAVAAGALVVTGVAAILPAALRASRTNPLTALRGE